jgi:hypothetical protein
MTHQEFNHIYYKFTKNERGIRLHDPIETNGYELKEFLEFAIKLRETQVDQQLQMESLFN